MGFRENIRHTEPLGSLELVAGQFDLEAIRIAQIDRVHEPAITLDELDAAFSQSSRRQGERSPRHIERQMLYATDFPWGVPPGISPGLVRKHGEQAAIARVKV